MENKHELAYVDYLSGMKQKDIAEKYGVSVNTVKSWSRRHEWIKKGAPIKQRVQLGKKAAKKKAKQIVKRTQGLSDEKQLFCVYFMKYHNATKAYMKVRPKVTYGGAAVNAHKWMRDPEIVAEINRLKEERITEVLLDPSDIMQKYIDIAFADITDYMEFGREWQTVMGPFGPIKVKNENTGKEQDLLKHVNVIKFKESTDVDGTILTEVKQGKDGASIKLADRMAALKELARIIGIDPDDEPVDDGFIDALNGSAKEDWVEDEDETSDV